MHSQAIFGKMNFVEHQNFGNDKKKKKRNKFELTIEEQRSLSDYCKSKGILYMCTPWDKTSVEILFCFHLNNPLEYFCTISAKIRIKLQLTKKAKCK